MVYRFQLKTDNSSARALRRPGPAFVAWFGVGRRSYRHRTAWIARHKTCRDLGAKGRSFAICYLTLTRGRHQV